MAISKGRRHFMVHTVEKKTTIVQNLYFEFPDGFESLNDIKEWSVDDPKWMRIKYCIQSTD